MIVGIKWQLTSLRCEMKSLHWEGVHTYETRKENILVKYKGADKSLARPGTKQAAATEDFDFDMSYL